MLLSERWICEGEHLNEKASISRVRSVNTSPPIAGGLVLVATTPGAVVLVAAAGAGVSVATAAGAWVSVAAAGASVSVGAAAGTSVAGSSVGAGTSVA